jgi:hypothetical protein
MENTEQAALWQRLGEAANSLDRPATDCLFEAVEEWLDGKLVEEAELATVRGERDSARGQLAEELARLDAAAFGASAVAQDMAELRGELAAMTVALARIAATDAEESSFTFAHGQCLLIARAALATDAGKLEAEVLRCAVAWHKDPTRETAWMLRCAVAALVAEKGDG